MFVGFHIYNTYWRSWTGTWASQTQNNLHWGTHTEIARRKRNTSLVAVGRSTLIASWMDEVDLGKWAGEYVCSVHGRLSCPLYGCVLPHTHQVHTHTVRVSALAQKTRSTRKSTQNKEKQLNAKRQQSFTFIPYAADHSTHSSQHGIHLCTSEIRADHTDAYSKVERSTTESTVVHSQVSRWSHSARQKRIKKKTKSRYSRLQLTISEFGSFVRIDGQTADG